MTGARWVFIGISLLILVVSSCSEGTPPPVQSDPPGLGVDEIVTSVFETMTAQASALTSLAQPTSPPSFPFTDTPALPSDPVLGTATESPIPPSPTITSSPAIPILSVSAPTNCRLGPKEIYESIAVAQVGSKYPLIGRNATYNSWVILLPDGRTCWVWGGYASIEGNPNVSEFPPPVGTVGGVVLSLSGSVPVKNAPVRILPLNQFTNTDNTGHYKFLNVPIGNITVSVELPRKQPVTLNIRLQTGQVITDANFAVDSSIPNDNSPNCPIGQNCLPVATVGPAHQ